MKSFFKIVLATLVALVLSFFVCLFLGIAILGGAAASLNSEKVTQLTEPSVLKIELFGMLQERTNEEDVQFIMSKLNDNPTPLSLEKTVKAIKAAKDNKNIKAIYLNCGMFGAAPASLEELRNTLIDFKTSGKKIISYADYYLQGTYYLASVSNEIVVNPKGMLNLPGIALQTMFYHEALENIGVEYQVFKVGTFKSAVEPYIRNNMSEANRLQMTRMANGLWDHMIQEMAASRNLKPQDFDNFADSGRFLMDTEGLVKDGFVTQKLYESSMDSLIKAEIEVEDLNMLSIKEMNAVPSTKVYQKDKIAILYAVGGIDDGSQTGMKSDKITKELLKLKDKDNVKAVVLRVSSPGGSAFGSEQMWHAAELLKAKKPLIVSMGDYAASGGYYMSCNSDYIIAQPNTITGSIGIFGLILNASKVTDKIGIHFDGVKTNKYSDMGRNMQGFSQAEGAIMQKMINQGYELFTGRVAQGRNMPQDSVKAIAEGRVWLGEDALKIGLVDELGGLDRAIEVAAEKAKLKADTYGIVSYPKQKDFMTKLLEDFDLSVQTYLSKAIFGSNAKYLNDIQTLKNMEGIQTRLPFIFNIQQ